MNSQSWGFTFYEHAITTKKAIADLHSYRGSSGELTISDRVVRRGRGAGSKGENSNGACTRQEQECPSRARHPLHVPQRLSQFLKGLAPPASSVKAHCYQTLRSSD
ncbi:MAG: hypothetical protein RMY28_002040 [Nostoc sp. ChiSLP01]|nr:hypothetical protein [Nostoc sp. CmiSLP01]MDZ8286573.1 hypothetical protein [Nostoc sp. ChiSLP01]